jgi:hypothetical protein
MVHTFQILVAVRFCPAAVFSNTDVFRCDESSQQVVSNLCILLRDCTFIVVTECGFFTPSPRKIFFFYFMRCNICQFIIGINTKFLIIAIHLIISVLHAFHKFFIALLISEHRDLCSFIYIYHIYVFIVTPDCHIR